MASFASSAQDITGQWYGTWLSPDLPVGRWASEAYPTGSILEVTIFGDGNPHFASLYLPELNVVDVIVPAVVNGNSIVLGPPGGEFAFGSIAEDAIAGIAFLPNPADPASLLLLNWQVRRPTVLDPGFPAGGTCTHGVAAYCAAGSDECTTLVQFDPPEGTGYLDYLVGEETVADQSRSWVRQDLMQLVKFAAAELQCQAEDWDFGSDAPIGLGDSSRADGTSPPGHNSHTNGDHIDIAYAQLYAPDYLLRPVGRYDLMTGYLAGPPSGLDAYRSAMFIAALGRHPNLWYIAVDEQAAQLIDVAFAELEARGWLPVGMRASINLLSGAQVTAGHYDHMHIAMQTLEPIIADIRFLPRVLRRWWPGRFLTAFIEPVDGVSARDIDVSSIRLLVDGVTAVNAHRTRFRIADFNRNGTPELMVRFDATGLSEVLEPGIQELAITGSANDVYFQESAIIRVR